MPGRHGKQRVKRKRSKRQPVTEMEKTLKDSIYGRKRKERQILKQLIPPPLAPRVNKMAVSATLPMFQAAPGAAKEAVVPVTKVAPAVAVSTPAVSGKKRAKRAAGK